MLLFFFAFSWRLRRADSVSLFSSSPSSRSSKQSEQHDDDAGDNEDDGGDGGGGILWQNLYVGIRLPAPAAADRHRHHGAGSAAAGDDSAQPFGGEASIRTLLDDFSGQVRNGRVCGLIGPSGSGKTTFLSTLLAGTAEGVAANGAITWTAPTAATGGVATNATATSTAPRKCYRGGKGSWIRSGQVWLYRQPVPAAPKPAGDDEDAEDTDTGDDDLDQQTVLLEPLHASQIAYLQQQDDFFELLSVRETLRLATFLELPRVDLQARNQLVETLLGGLGLAHAANHRVGNPRSGHYDDQRHRHNLMTMTDFNSDQQQLMGCGDGNEDTIGGDGFRRAFLFWTTRWAVSGHGHHGRLSGGERRRLSVALELVTEKLVLIADEPTTGLDSARSLQVVRLIRQLAINKNIPCLISLHGPRSKIFNDLLDDCIVMAPGGRVCYAGPVNGVPAYFARYAKHPIPPNTNIAEFLVDLVSVDTENNTQTLLDEARIDDLVKTYRQYEASVGGSTQRHQWGKTRIVRSDYDVDRYDEGRADPDDMPTGIQSSSATRLSPLWSVVRRFGALLRRSWRQNVRNHSVNIFRFFASTGNAFLLAQIFPSVRRNFRNSNSVNIQRGENNPVGVNSIADRVALLSFGAINMGMMAYMKTVDVFAREKPVIRREQLRRQYSAVEYLLAKAVTDLPLDAMFSALFTTILKLCTSLVIPWNELTATYALMTTSLSSLGLALGAWLPLGDPQATMTAR